MPLPATGGRDPYYAFLENQTPLSWEPRCLYVDAMHTVVTNYIICPCYSLESCCWLSPWDLVENGHA